MIRYQKPVIYASAAWRIVRGMRPRMTCAYKNIFVDAEGTLYVPKKGNSWFGFWSNPSPSRALRFFRLDEGVSEALQAVRERAETLCVVSWNNEPILNALLEGFGIGHYFDAILMNADKGDLIGRFVAGRALRKEESLMVGDMPHLDVYPVRRVGIEAILVDREYNRWARVERIGGLKDLPAWLKIADIADGMKSSGTKMTTLDEFGVLGTSQMVSASMSFETKRLIGAALH